MLFDDPVRAVADFSDGVNLLAGVTTPRDALFQYARRVIDTYTLMLPWLPDEASDVLDIGCGMGGISYRMSYLYPEATFHLLDGTAADEPGREGKHRHPGYRPFDPWQRPWNNAAYPCARLRELGLKAVDYSADPMQVIPADVIVSTRSWGHHYPVSVYLPLVRRSLRPGGVVFLDVRSGTDGLAEMSRHFDLLWSGTTSATNKCTFAAFKRKES
jgi:SAM-dependent methyltransferase